MAGMRRRVLSARRETRGARSCAVRARKGGRRASLFGSASGGSSEPLESVTTRMTRVRMRSHRHRLEWSARDTRQASGGGESRVTRSSSKAGQALTCHVRAWDVCVIINLHTQHSNRFLILNPLSLKRIWIKNPGFSRFCKKSES